MNRVWLSCVDEHAIAPARERRVPCPAASRRFAIPAVAILGSRGLLVEGGSMATTLASVLRAASSARAWPNTSAPNLHVLVMSATMRVVIALQLFATVARWSCRDARRCRAWR